MATTAVAPEAPRTELSARYNAAQTFIDANRIARPDAIAIRCQGKSITYGQLGANVDRPAEGRHLCSNDVEADASTGEIRDPVRGRHA